MNDPDSRRARSRATQAALMRAAEKRIAELGIERVSIRDIVGAAGQKNESALQYHFKSLTGLIAAIHEERSAEIQARRGEMLDALLAEVPAPTLRQLCAMMVEPAFRIARSDVGFRRYVKAFGHELALAEASTLSRAFRHGGGGGESGHRLALLLRGALPHLDADAYRRRIEHAIRLCAASMYHHARQTNAFRGTSADLFLNSLIDALVGLMSAPVSTETAALAAELEQRTS